jgi:stearoyl-CoA desaturase (Delta-9 desaturase)
MFAPIDSVSTVPPASQRAPLEAVGASRWQSLGRTLRRWVDTEDARQLNAATGERIDWLRVAPFIGLHLASIGVIWVGVSRTAVTVAAMSYVIRMFALTGFYHRYFSHRTFRTSRALQFVFALIGASSVQRGPLWWAAHHRNHHQHADTERDPHSPAVYGFIRSHMGWFLTPNGYRADLKRVPDLVRYPELRWLDRYDVLVPIAYAAALYGLGALLAHLAPDLGTSGGQLLMWGFFISTVVLFHVSVTINSLAHRFGSRRFDTPDHSRNNLWLALLTFGEGWHNNHHFFPGSARQGFRWWEIDLTFYGLRLLAALGLVHGLRPVPARIYARARR